MAAHINKGYFTKVKVARELLREQAEGILKNYLEVVEKAKEAGDYRAAAKMLEWLMAHMPSENDGTRVVDSNIDNQQPVAVKEQRPAIQIGIQVGGVGPPKSLPAATTETVDAE